MICIFTEGEGDGIEVIEPRLPFKIFSTLVVQYNSVKIKEMSY